jgi:[acyl-carrier-protein] S-malonyltransferase
MKRVAIFPGQGSQHPGMGRYLWDNFAVARDCFEEASETLSIDMRKMCFEGSEVELSQTINTQPALVLVSTATWRVLKSLTPLDIAGFAGHSVGEYAALCAANVISFTAALRAVRRRGELMQQAVPVGEGGMTAVLGLSAEEVGALCAWAASGPMRGPIEPANFNAPDQVVISGRRAALDWLQSEYRPDLVPGLTGRAKFIPLKVSAPFHCSMMKPAEEAMRPLLEALKFADASVPVVPNESARPSTEAQALRECLIKQITASVRWVECIAALRALGADEFCEIGSGKVLAGLNKKILGPQVPSINFNSIEDIKAFERRVGESA